MGCNFSGNPDEVKEAMAKCEYNEAGKKEKISVNSYCSIPYRYENWTQTWLREEKQRALETTKLILNTTFTEITFKRDRSYAIDHFMLTNDSSRFEPLNSYDLVSAYVVKLTRVELGEKMNSHQKKIKKYWDEISQDLYFHQKGCQEDHSFFFSWLLATGRRESTAKRYTKDKSWNGVKKEFDERTDDDGFQYESIADVFREMRDFSKIYLRLIDTKHDFWNQDPYNTANCRNEKNLLRIISTIPNEVQHIHL